MSLTPPLPRAVAAVVAVALVAIAALVVPELWTSLAAVEGLVHLPVAVAVLLACAGVGLAFLRVARIDAGEDAAWIAVPIGAALVGHVQLALAHLGLFGLASSFLLVWTGLALLFAMRRHVVESRWPLASAPWLAACAPFVAAALFLCAAPPTFYDALVYHVGLIEQLVLRGDAGLSAVVTQHDMYTAMPLAAELAAGTAFAITRAHESMGLVNALLFVVLIVGAAAVARRAFGEASAGPAAFVVASMPLPLFLAAAIKPDVLTALLFLVALRAALHALHDNAPFVPLDSMANRGRVDARLLFVALGLACAAKLSALPIGAAATLALLAVPASRRALLANPPRALGIALVLGAALACPPYLRNALALGNPVYPFASSIFGGPAWLAHTAALLDADAQRVRSLADVGPLLARPFFTSEPFANELVGPLALFALLAPVVVLRRRAVVVLAAIIGATLVPWLFTHALPRYDPVLWLGLALLAGAALARIVDTRLKWLAIPLVFALALVNASWSLRANDALLRGPMRHLVGAEEREDTLKRALDLLPAYQSVTYNGCVFLATGEPRIAYLAAPAVLGEVYTQPPLVAVLEGAARADEVIARIRATGATHLLLDDRAPSLLERRGWTVNAPLLAEVAGVMPLVHKVGTARLLEVPAAVAGRCAMPD